MMLFNALYATSMLLPICFELGDIGKADKWLHLHCDTVLLWSHLSVIALM